MRKDFQPFWFVWCADGGVPNYKHSSIESAQREARRLAQLNRERTFIVLQSVCATFVVDVETVDMRPPHDDGIPF